MDQPENSEFQPDSGRSMKYFRERAKELIIAVRLSQRSVFPAFVILVNFIIYLIFAFSSNYGFDDTASQETITGLKLLLFGAKVNALIGQGEYFRFISSMFLHGSMIHLIMNCIGIYYLGQLSENIFGRKRFLVMYFFSGIGGALLSYFTVSSPSVGASGAVFGLLGGTAVFGVKNRKKIPVSMKRFLVAGPLFYIALNLIYGLSMPSIDNAAHIGGLLSGIAMGYFFHNQIITDRSSLPGESFINILLLITSALCIYALTGSFRTAALDFELKKPSFGHINSKDGIIPFPEDWKPGLFEHGTCRALQNRENMENFYETNYICFTDPYNAMLLFADARLLYMERNFLSHSNNIHQIITSKKGVEQYFIYPYGTSRIMVLITLSPLADKYEQMFRDIVSGLAGDDDYI